ncbi:MAG: response regulator [Sphingobium sp.]|uniref:response regulator transcription factor n=1 Tax=Sphingobium sp. TaxID=1912891 RepID=UPI0029BD93F8|nr:response regulator [Sphingobium sp.]MDX3911145.1 response regulator [Sphingobium sp.]
MHVILIVEAEIVVRTALAEYLRECGYQVLEAVSGTEARTILANPATDIDILLAAAQLPDESGFQLSAWARERCPSIEVLLAGSVAKAAEKAGNLCEDGPQQTLPYNHKNLLARIRRLLAARHRNLNSSGSVDNLAPGGTILGNQGAHGRLVAS